MGYRMIQINKARYRYTFSYWHAFIIPLMVMAAGCIGSGIFPFGNQSFLRNDLYNQYMPFFQALHDRIWQGEGISYSFELGLGSGFDALYGYYLASPVNWLVVLCPRSLIAEFITILILVKMSLAGVSFAHYLRRHFGKDDIGILLFSSAYALSGFMAAYQWNIMWLDVVWLAPLVLLALEELILQGRGVKYCLLLASSIFTNFYLSIMLCIFLVLYFLLTVVWEPWRVKIRSAFLFGWYSLLAGGLSCVMLLPVYFALSGTEFHEFHFPNAVKWYMSFLEELARHCMNVSMKVQADHWPNVYCGVAVFLFVPLFLFNRRISWKNKVSRLLLAAIFLLSFSCNILDFIWHGFNYPDSLPGRQSYLYIWLLLVIGYEVYLQVSSIRLWQIIVSALAGCGVVISAWCLTDVEGTNLWTYVCTLVFLSLYLILLVLRYAWNYPRFRERVRATKWKTVFQNRCLGVKVLALLLVVVELSCNMYVTSLRTVNRTNYMKHFSNREGVIEWMKEQDEGLYRTEVFGRLTKNDSMMWDIKTATIFSSTISAKVVDLYRSLGLGTTRVSYWYQGATPLVSAMLGIKYMIGEDDSMDNELYEVLYSFDAGCLYRCNYSLPLGYVIDPSLENAWNLDTYNPVRAQNEFCHLLGINGDLLVPVSREVINEREYRVPMDNDGYLFVYLGNNSLSEVKVEVGDEEQTFKQVSFDYLLDVGMVKAGEEAVFTVEKEDQKFHTFKAYELNMRVLKEAIEILGQTPLEVTEYGETFLKGNVKLQEAGKLVISIPKEKGWTLYVNGVQTSLGAFKDTFLAADLEAGEYDIELRYETPGFDEGLCISLGCSAILGLCHMLEKRKQKKTLS